MLTFYLYFYVLTQSRLSLSPQCGETEVAQDPPVVVHTPTTMTDVDLHADTVPVVTVVTAIEVHLDETTMKIVEDTIALPQEEAALVTTIRPPRVPVVTTILTAVTIPLLTLT